MTPGRRGWLVLAIVATAWAFGSYTGYRYSEQRWEGWTYAHVAFETKGDKR